jgi:hypothetical protein
MRHDTKIAMVVRDDLASWQILNVVAYLASALAASRGSLSEPAQPALAGRGSLSESAQPALASRDGVIGEPYEDASGRRYLAMFGQPVLVFSASSEELDTVRRRSADRDLPVAIFTDELFSTGDDEANRAAVRAVASEKLTLAGLGVHGGRSVIDKVLKGLRLHP